VDSSNLETDDGSKTGRGKRKKVLKVRTLPGEDGGSDEEDGQEKKKKSRKSSAPAAGKPSGTAPKNGRTREGGPIPTPPVTAYNAQRNANIQTAKAFF